MRTVPVYDSAAFRLPLVYEFRELLRYRFLVWNLIIRDLKVRYKRSFLGFAWVMLNPLLTMIVLTIVFSAVFRYNVNHYAVYLLAGTLLWNVFAQGTNAAMSNIQGNGAILRKLYLPPSVFVASAVGSALMNLLFAVGPFYLLALADGLSIRASWAYVVGPFILATLFTFGVGLIVGALIVFFNDIFEIYQVLLNAFYFLTPIFYPVHILPEPLRSFERYNPMYLAISTFRDAVGANSPPLPGTPHVSILVACAISLGTLLVGWVFFTRVEGRFVYYF